MAVPSTNPLSPQLYGTFGMGKPPLKKKNNNNNNNNKKAVLKETWNDDGPG